METKRPVDEIEPFCKWRKEELKEVLEVHLQGFKKEQLRVQINNHGVLTTSGERPLDQNKRVRFCKLIKVSNDCKSDGIHAKFSGGILYITMPKRIPLLLPTQNQENGNAKQNNNIDETAGTNGTLSMISKPTKCMSGLTCSVPRLQQMGGKTALKLGALVAVMVVAAVGAYAAYNYRRGFLVGD